MFKPYLLILCVFNVFFSCSSNKNSDNKKNQMPENAPQGSYGYDKQFLQKHDSNIVELRSGNSSVLISPAYQAKVFTSTADGHNGKSFGWINYKVFGGPADPHINAYGGENRVWLGPAGGKDSLYYKKGDSMVFENWKTPAPIDTENWEVDKKNDQAVTLKKNISITNYAGTLLNMHVTREIAVQDKNKIESTLLIQIGDSVKFVGYSTN